MVTVIKKGTPLEEIKKKVDAIVSKSRRSNIRKYAGSVKLNIDPLEWQKKIRDEWE